MPTLYHHPFCAHSRFCRLVLGELGRESRLSRNGPGSAGRNFVAHPAGATPVLAEDDGLVVPGAGPLAAYLDDTAAAPSTGSCRARSQSASR